MKNKICIVAANYYPKISKNLIDGATKILREHGFNNYKIFKLPGIFELPFVITKNINKYDGFIALGCVIKGQTPHFEFISQATINSIMDLSIRHKIPIGNGIITSLNKKQATDRSSSKKNKGKESALALISLLKI